MAPGAADSGLSKSRGQNGIEGKTNPIFNAEGMMRMMMSHMMGGPGGMGYMMGQMGAGMKGYGGGPRGMDRMGRTLDGLNLTPEQWDQGRELARKRLGKMAVLWAQRMKLQIELAAMKWDKGINPQKVKEIFAAEAEAEAEMFLTSLDYLRRLKSVLDPEQIEKLESRNL